MISVSFISHDEAEVQVSTPDDAVLGQHRASLRDVPGRTRPVALNEDVDFVHNTDELRASPNSLSQNSAPISTEEPILCYLPHSLIPTCAFTFQTGCGLSSAEIKAYSPSN